MAALAPLRYILGQQLEEEPNYLVLLDESHVQIRHYQTYYVAKVRVESDEEDQSRETAYMRLLNYALGKNSRRERLEAMAPLVQEDVGAHRNALLQLAAPGLDQVKAFEVSLVLPLDQNQDTAPSPLDDEIRVERVAPHLTAVLRFSGFCGPRKKRRLTKYLYLWLHDRGYRAISAARVAKYNPPFTLPFFRRNELHIDVIKR